MRLVDRLREDAGPIWEKLTGHPFVAGLCRGELPRERFEYYILQDYHYLVTTLRNFSIIASRAPDVDALREIIDILHLEARSEFDGYIALLERLGYSLDDASGIEPMPVSVSYGGFLVSTSTVGSYAEAITAVLPCFWSYAEIARRWSAELGSNEVELYRDWGAAYAGREYLALVEKLKGLVDRAGEGAPYEGLKSAFMTAARYEYMFWDAVHSGRSWPV